jgi:hypothetical protein
VADAGTRTRVLQRKLRDVETLEELPAGSSAADALREELEAIGGTRPEIDEDLVTRALSADPSSTDVPDVASA